MALKERGQWLTKLLTTAKTLGIMMPIISLALMVLAAAKAYSSTHQFEVILCLTYAAVHLTVNILVAIGCEAKNRSYLIPWLVWIIFSIAMSITMATFLISNAIHLVTVPDDQDSLGTTGLITLSILLLIKSGFYGYFWFGVFDLFKDLETQATITTTTATTTSIVRVSQEAPPPLQMPDEMFATSSANLIDRPPTYQKALRCTFVVENERTTKTKSRTRRIESPPSYKEVAAKTTQKLHLFRIRQNFKPSLTPTRV